MRGASLFSAVSKKPGAFLITDGSESSVMKALSLSEGLDSFSSRNAYIYRVEGGRGSRSEITVPLRKLWIANRPTSPGCERHPLYTECDRQEGQPEGS